MTGVPPSVRLRPYADGDLGLLRGLLGDPGVMTHLGGPESPEALAARHERYLAADPLTNGLFTIVAGDEATPVGWIGFWESPFDGEPAWECGWHVLPGWQGRGVASRAGELLLDEARARRRHRYVDAFPAIDNPASNALCRTLGFLDLGEAEVEYPKGHQMAARHWRYDLGER